MHTERTLCEDEGRGWADASVSQLTPEIAGKSVESHGIYASSQSFEGNSPAD